MLTLKENIECIVVAFIIIAKEALRKIRIYK